MILQVSSRSRHRPLWLVTWACLVCAGQVRADSAGFFPEEHAIYSVEFSREVSDWRGNGMTIETRNNRLSLNYSEPISTHLQGGVRLGHETMTQSGNPLTEGFQPDGYFLGVMLTGQYYFRPSMLLDMSAAYTFNNVNDEQTSQQIRLDWHELGLEANLIYNYRSLTLLAGVGARVLDIDEIASGTVNSTRSFRQASTGTVHLGLSFQVDPTGRIGIDVMQGARQSTGLVFERRY